VELLTLEREDCVCGVLPLSSSPLLELLLDMASKEEGHAAASARNDAVKRKCFVVLFIIKTSIRIITIN